MCTSCLYICKHIYIYICIYRERDRYIQLSYCFRYNALEGEHVNQHSVRICLESSIRSKYPRLGILKMECEIMHVTWCI